MSSVNTNREQEQSGNDSRVEVASLFHNEIESFDNPEKYPDLEFVVAEMEKPLQLHRKILAESSACIKTMLDEKRSQRLEWPFDTTKEVDREALVKALRFCYGETQTVGTKNGECIAMVVALTRLQVACSDESVTQLNIFVMEEAKRNLEIGVELLKACAGYKEMSGTSQLTLGKELAAIILTKDNMRKHYKEVVDDCLMVLPPEYLMIAEFGEPHTRLSEFCLRTKYVRYHANELDEEQKQAMVTKCDWSTLNSQELRELRLARVIDKDELLKAHERALEYREIENEQGTEVVQEMKRKMEEKVKAIEHEKDKETKRAEKAEAEREELRKRAEMAETEKEEKVKQAEMERDEKVKASEIEKNRCAKEAEECKKRVEKTENEREEESKRARKAEADREEIRLRAEKAEKEKGEKEARMKDVERERDLRAKEAEEYKRRTEKAEREKEEENKRAMKAEAERDEFRARAERAEKEKGEKEARMKDVERERDLRAKEAEELRKRAEKAEKDKEDLLKHIEALENFMKGNRLL